MQRLCLAVIVSGLLLLVTAAGLGLFVVSV